MRFATDAELLWTGKLIRTEVINAASHLIGGFVEGITGGVQKAIDGIVGFGEAVVGGFCDFFGIHSPSTLMRDDVGRWIAQGITEGKGEVTVLRQKTFATLAWKASGQSSYNGYDGSDIDTFCNDTHVQRLDPAVRACLIDVPIPVARGADYSSTVSNVIRNLMRHGFLLSCTECGLSGYATEGSVFSYLNTQANRVAYGDGTSTAVCWWLRSPNSNYYHAYYVLTDGAQSNSIVYNAYYYCPRPALTLSSEILVSDSVDGDGCYVIEDLAIAGENYQKVNGVWRRLV